MLDLSVKFYILCQLTSLVFETTFSSDIPFTVGKERNCEQRAYREKEIQFTASYFLNLTFENTLQSVTTAYFFSF